MWTHLGDYVEKYFCELKSLPEASKKVMEIWNGGQRGKICEWGGNVIVCSFVITSYNFH